MKFKNKFIKKLAYFDGTFYLQRSVKMLKFAANPPEWVTKFNSDRIAIQYIVGKR